MSNQMFPKLTELGTVVADSSIQLISTSATAAVSTIGVVDDIAGTAREYTSTMRTRAALANASAKAEAEAELAILLADLAKNKA